MATRLYSLSRQNPGANNRGVTEGVGGAMETSDEIEFKIDLAVGLDRKHLYKALRQLAKHFMADNYPPA